MERHSQKVSEMTRSGLNLIKQAISIYDQDLTLLVANRRFKNMFSLPAHLTEIGASFAETIYYLVQAGEYGSVDDIDVFVTERVEQAKAFMPHYVERKRANGSTISIEGSPLRQGGWVTVYTDITDVKRQEELLRGRSKGLSEQLIRRSEQLALTNRELTSTITALEQAQQELIESESRLQSTNAMIPAHIARVDTDGYYTYTNQKLFTVIPGSPKNIVGMHMQKALGIEVYKIVRPKFDDAMQGTPSAFEFALKESGKQVRLSITPDVNDDGTVRGAYLLSMDITKETNARQALMHARRRELAAQLTSGLAHDFANLLTIILGQQNKLEAIDELPSNIREIVSTTKDAALRGGTLLEGLGQFNSMRTLALKPVNVDTLIDQLTRLIGAAINSEESGIELEICNEIEDPQLMLDQGFMQDALLNLALNAKEAISGAGKIQLKFLKSPSDWLEIKLCDSGPGFSEYALKNAFTPFYTTKKGKVGRGMGLTTVFDFAKMNGGRVILDNQQNGGAKVTLLIPYTKVETTKSGLVLLVEDNPDIRETIRGYLQKMGHSVLEADSAEEAEHLGGLPDLSFVVSDLMLQGDLTGYDLAVNLRKTGVEIPIYIVTGLPASDPIRMQASKKFPVLAKPFSFEKMIEQMQVEETLQT